jgi:hypothetical protein
LFARAKREKDVHAVGSDLGEIGESGDKRVNIKVEEDGRE